MPDDLEECEVLLKELIGLLAQYTLLRRVQELDQLCGKLAHQVDLMLSVRWAETKDSTPHGMAYWEDPLGLALLRAYWALVDLGYMPPPMGAPPPDDQRRRLAREDRSMSKPTSLTVTCLDCGWRGQSTELREEWLVGEADAIPLPTRVCPRCESLAWELAEETEQITTAAASGSSP